MINDTCAYSCGDWVLLSFRVFVLYVFIVLRGHCDGHDAFSCPLEHNTWLMIEAPLCDEEITTNQSLIVEICMYQYAKGKMMCNENSLQP